PNREWGRYTCRDLLTNVVYLGTLRIGIKRLGKYTGCGRHGGHKATDLAERRGARERRHLKGLPRVRNAPETVLETPNAHEALVPVEAFRAAQARLAGRRHADTTPVRDGRWLLSGLVWCGCGEKLWGWARQTRKGSVIYRYPPTYVCAGRRGRK